LNPLSFKEMKIEGDNVYGCGNLKVIVDSIVSESAEK
jgi:hypothetical protein